MEATMNNDQSTSTRTAPNQSRSAGAEGAGLASSAVSKIADVAQQAGDQAKQTASSLATEATRKTKGYLNQQVSASADLAGHVAEAVKCAADNLDDKAPQMADFVRDAADRVETFSHDLRGQSVEQLMGKASDFTRKQPALVFGLASLAGFFLFRVLKSKPSDEMGGSHHRVREHAGQFDGD
jgi:hypothetical protein